MIRAFFLTFLAVIGPVALFAPWIGVAAAYSVILLQPQNLWPWGFSTIRPFYWIGAPTVVGTVLALITRRLGFRPLRTPLTAFILMWWLCTVLSFYLGPFVHEESPYRNFYPDGVLSNMNKSFLFYFVACLCIDTQKKLRCLVWVMAGTVLYYTYWGNWQYLNGNVRGRLGGPDARGGFSDENAFATLLIIGLPFLYYLGMTSKRRIVRYALWLAMPFGWHVVFLTGSRGGMLGLGATILLMTAYSRRRLLGLALIPIFISAYIWQGGHMLQTRMRTIQNYPEESAARTRVEAWEAAVRMMADRPLTGVGLSSFEPAFPRYSDKDPRAAHNTYLQISAESGVAAGLGWLGGILYAMFKLAATARRLERPGAREEDILHAQVVKALLVALVGFGICSIFLSLQGHEAFFYLLALSNCVIVSEKKTALEERKGGP